MHTGEEIGIDNFQADRGPDHRYRTSPLKALWTHTKGGFYHDGRFATLLDVVAHYDSVFTLGLSDGERRDLVEYLKSLGDDVAPSVVKVLTLNAGLEGLSEAEAGRAEAASRLSVWPSPVFSGQNVHVDLALAPGAAGPRDLEVSIYDLAGRRVGAQRGAPTGASGLVWNGRDDTGRSAPPGIYFVRVRAPSVGLSEERRIVVR